MRIIFGIIFAAFLASGCITTAEDVLRPYETPATCADITAAKLKHAERIARVDVAGMARDGGVFLAEVLVAVQAIHPGFALLGGMAKAVDIDTTVNEAAVEHLATVEALKC